MTDVTGWDIGGAHLKAARLRADGSVEAVVQLPCPLWRGLEYLEQAVDETLATLGRTDRHAVTMTGELADIFPDRHQGVTRIVDTMRRQLPDAEMRVFAGQRGFVVSADAARYTTEIASANWLASAQFIAQKVGQGLLIDMGSTTTDIVLLQAGRAKPQGLTDAARLAADELVYTGIIRTPLMAVAQRAPFNGVWQRLAAEHFATMADVYRLTGDLEPLHDMTETADGAGKTLEDSARRLARMAGRDFEAADMASWVALARFFAQMQLQDVRAAVDRVLSRSPSGGPLVGAGAGRFVVRELARQMRREYLDFSNLVEGEDAVKEWAAVCAPACSVAWLGMQP